MRQRWDQGAMATSGGEMEGCGTVGRIALYPNGETSDKRRASPSSAPVEGERERERAEKTGSVRESFHDERAVVCPPEPVLPRLAVRGAVVPFPGLLHGGELQDDDALQLGSLERVVT